MASEEELERMVIRLIGDVDQYLAALNEAAEATEETADKVKTTSQKIQEFGDSLISYGTKLSVAVTTPITAMGALATAAWGVQEAAEMTLQGLLDANERATQTLFRDYAEFASGLQQITTTGDETTLVMLRTAESLGVTGAAAKTAVKEAMGLGAALGMSAKSAIRYTAMLAEGDTMMLNRYIPTLRKIEDQDERVAEAHRVLARMFAVAETEAATFTGSLQQLYNDTGDLYEQFGKVIADRIKPFISMLRDVVFWFQGLSPETKEMIVLFGGLAAAIGPVLLAVGTLIKLLPILHAGLSTLVAHPVIAAIAVLTVGITALVAQWREYNRIVAEGNQISTEAVDATLRIAKSLDLGADAARRMMIATRQIQIMDLTEQFEEADRKSRSFWRRQSYWQKEATRLAEERSKAQVALSNLRSGGDIPGWDEESPAETMAASFKEAVENAEKLTAELEKQNQTFGMDATAVKIWELEQANAPPEAIARVKELAQALKEKAEAQRLDDQARKDALQAQKDYETKQKNIETEGQRIIEQFATPFEIAQKKIQDYMRLREALGDQVFGETFNRAVQGAIDEYKKAIEDQQPEIEPQIKPAAVQTIARGSVEEMLLIQEHRMTMAGGDRTRQQRDSSNLQRAADGVERLIDIVEGGGLVPANLNR